MPNTTIVILVSATPKMTPNAIPVNAECPNASEKNAILRLTIIVPNIPNSGVMINMATNAFLINPYSNPVSYTHLLSPTFFKEVLTAILG